MTGTAPPATRMTPQRAAVLRALGNCSDFLSAQMLHARLVGSGYAVGLSTVYRALHQLYAGGHLDVVRDRAGERLYRRRSGHGHQHYLLCRRCGHSRAVDARVVERWAEHIGETSGFSAVEHTVELTGVCGGCQNRGL